jgi:hypothetical protein
VNVEAMAHGELLRQEQTNKRKLNGLIYFTWTDVLLGEARMSPYMALGKSPFYFPIVLCIYVDV